VPDPTVDQLPPDLTVATDSELPARIVVHDLRRVGGGAGDVALVLGDVFANAGVLPYEEGVLGSASHHEQNGPLAHVAPGGPFRVYAAAHGVGWRFGV
jgi:hypothetical protein